MATRTSTDLVIEILEKLVAIPEGQAPESDDTARVTLDLPSVLAELAAREIVYVSDPANIPEEWFMSLAKVCAYEMRSKFGVTGEQLVDLTKANAEGIDNLRVMTRGRPTYEPMQTVSF
jgi:hypothetical protein